MRDWRIGDRGMVHENGQHLTTNTFCMVPQSVPYQKLPYRSALRHATSQTRLLGVLGRKSMYETFLAVFEVWIREMQGTVMG